LIKAEAQKRILAKYPLWKQNSMLADKLSIIQKEVKTQEDIDALAEIELGLGEIKHIRERSDAIELMDPIPSDYTVEDYWE
jgi:hypothetical protein